MSVLEAGAFGRESSNLSSPTTFKGDVSLDDQLRKKCCEEREDIIKGRRLSDSQSKIFHGWIDILNVIDEEALSESVKDYIKPE